MLRWFVDSSGSPVQNSQLAVGGISAKDQGLLSWLLSTVKERKAHFSIAVTWRRMEHHASNTLLLESYVNWISPMASVFRGSYERLSFS